MTRMRSRSNSGVRLDYYHRIVFRCILEHQNPVTGLLPTTNNSDHAWVRDNLYCIIAVWSLSMAYKKNTDLDEDRAKTYELEQSCVKLMRGLLMSMIRQKDKVERFKQTQSPLDSLHAKYSASTMLSVVGDCDYGHLQIDCISLYLLLLAQMTASGLQIIFTLDEVAFVQNLVFYIESAYCIPDYGVWERGDKTNHGLPELNASSIGMAKAALEAMNSLDLFGGRGGPASVIHVLADEAQKCAAVLQSMLPRESNSKEIDAGLLAIIGFPAFAVEDSELIKQTRDEILSKLRGKYGCKRFLRDGHRTARENPSRLYYEPSELKVFENIECEWPLFWCYLILDAIFRGDREAVDQFSDALDKVIVKTDDGLKLVPEMYSVPSHLVELEYKTPHSQQRDPIGQCPFKWAQSLYIVGRLLQEGFIATGELDPLNRRLSADKKPDVVVQVVILAENKEIQAKFAQHDIHVQTIDQVAPIEVQPARVLSHLYAYLGRNRKLKLSGRQSRDVGILSTSKLYSLHDRILAFIPQNLDLQDHYLVNDIEFSCSFFRSNLHFLKSNWSMLGRPTVTYVYPHQILENDKIPPSVLSTIRKLKSGYINGTRVVLGRLDEFLSTSCIASLSFLDNTEEGDPDNLSYSVKEYLEKELQKPLFKPVSKSQIRGKSMPSRMRKSGVTGIIKRTRSIQVDQYDPVNDEENLPSNLAIPGSPSNQSSRNQSITSPPGELYSSTTISIPRISTTVQARDGEPMSPTLLEESNEDAICKGWSALPGSEMRIRAMNDLHISDEDILSIFRNTESLEEQGDILHFLAYNRGLDWNTNETLKEDNQISEVDVSNNSSNMSSINMSNLNKITVKDLLKELYERACHDKKWALVRHVAGILGKRVEDLAKAVTDLLVRQKQVTVGMPPYSEHTITRPLPSQEIRQIINQAHGGDQSTAMLTQELLVYLAMFIRTEPNLFAEMLRLRVGLIIQVMASELGRALKCSGEEASEHLLNLSPFEMKTLLHHILSGKEFALKAGYKQHGHVSLASEKLSRKSNLDNFIGKETSQTGQDDGVVYDNERQGQWLRRRRLDGALNRVPKGFYPKIWSVLETCDGILIENKLLSHHLTQEMTPGELKFALQVEQVLNSIPQPEYRQLIVEALMVVTLLIEYNSVKSLGGIINVEQIVHKAHSLFLEDQRKCDGDATLCCTSDSSKNCAGKICKVFLDSAPSGCFGSMTYFIRAIFHLQIFEMV